MKRKITFALALLVLAISLAACTSTKLAKGFDKDAVTAKAEKTIEVINTLDYSAVAALVRKDLQPQITADQLKQGWDKTLTSLGAFEKYDAVTVFGANSGGVDYAVAVVTAKYKNGSAIYTISFDPNMELAGLYMK